MLKELRKMVRCPKCGSVLTKEYVVVYCDNCGKEIERGESVSRDLVLSIFYEDDCDHVDELDFCSWKCLREYLLKMTKDDLEASEVGFMTLPFINTEDFDKFVKEFLRGG